MPKPTKCLIQSRGERAYYRKELARVTKAIKRTHHGIYGDYNRKPSEMLAVIDTPGFYIVPMRGHSQQEKDIWLAEVLNRNP